MTQPRDDMHGATPSVADLFGRYLREQAAAHERGLGLPESAGEVELYDAVPVQPADPQLAWQDALAVLPHLTAEGAKGLAVPPEWPVLVNAQEPMAAVAFALGHFPQMVRHLNPLLAGDLTGLRPVPRPALDLPALAAWANGRTQYPEVLLGAAALRLCRRYDEAAALLAKAGPAPAAWQAARANEEAALAWHRGDAAAARALWRACPEGVPVLFNRGMAALFLGDRAEAREALTKAVAGLPETSAWHHLGRLYLTLA